MHLELLAFDCDGTLIDSRDIKGEAFRSIGTRLFGCEAGDALAAYHHMTGGTNRALKFAWLFSQYADRTPNQEELRALSEEFYERCFAVLKTAPLVQGAMETLERWHGVLPMRVVSGAPQDEMRELLDARGLSRFFVDIHGYPPTKDDLLRQVITLSGATGATTLMIGDGEADRQAAERSGAFFYGVGSGWNGRGVPWCENLMGFNAWLEKQRN